jgi:hypothetical protein
MKSRFEHLRDDLERQEEAFSREENKAGEKTSKALEKEIEKIRKEYKENEANALKEINRRRLQAEQGYCATASGIIYQSLEHDIHLLKERSGLVSLTEPEMQKSRRIHDLLRRITSEEEKQRLLSMLDILGVSKSVIEMAETPVHESEITSFTGSYEGRCILLAPVTESSSAKLVKNLENKLVQIVEQDKLGNEKLIIDFKGSYDTVNNFLMFTLDLDQQNMRLTDSLEACLAAKLRELQPEEFEGAKLIHAITSIEFRILEYFRTNRKNDFNIAENIFEAYRASGRKEFTIEEAAQTIGKEPRAIKGLVLRGKLQATPEGAVTFDSLVSYYQAKLAPRHPIEISARAYAPKMQYNSNTIDGRKAEALERLSKITDSRLNTKQLGYILGQKPTSATLVMPKLQGAVKMTDRKSYWLVPRESVAPFIQSYMPTNSGWKSQKPKKHEANQE